METEHKAPEANNDAEKPDSDGETPEAVEQKKEVRESAESVEELLTQWHEEYTVSETPDDRKRELAWRMLKLEQALRIAGLKAADVKIAELEPGTLGFYIPATDELFLTPEGLGDPEHYTEVLYHEKTHKEGILDEGLAQIVTLQHVSGARHAIYEAEQLRITRTFDVPELIERYDIDDADAFVTYFLEQEAVDRWEHAWRKKAEHETLSPEEGRRREQLHHLLREDIKKIEETFEKALPSLYEEATKGEKKIFETAVLDQVLAKYEEEAEQREKKAA